MPSGADDEGEYQYPYPRPPLFHNLSDISVRRGSAKFSFQLCIFFFNKNV